MRFRQIFAAALLLMLILQSCRPATPTPPPPATNTPDIAATRAAAERALTAAALIQPVTTATLVHTRTALPTSTEPPSTQVPNLASTQSELSIPFISVTTTTNCRTGPGTEFESVGVLQAGEVTQILSRMINADYWLVQNPDRSGACWLWGQNAVTLGNVNLVPLVTAQPTQAPPALTVSSVSLCRSGPADYYQQIGTIDAGESVDLLGRDKYSDYWLVENPDASGSCWVSGEFASFSGDMDLVEEAATPTSVGRREGYACEIVKRSADDAQPISPGADFDLWWEIKNIGTETWAASEVIYRFDTGTPTYKYESSYPLPQEVKPGEKITITVDMIAPDSLGSYTSTWVLLVRDFTICNLPFSIQVK
jgi:uncharacterized protein YraI